MKTINFLFLFVSFCSVIAQSSTKNTSKTVKIQPGTSNPSAKKFLFLGSYTMRFTAKDTKGKTTNGEIRSAYDEYKMATLPNFSTDKENNLRSFFDLRENTMTMLITDLKKNKKSGMVMKIPKVTYSDSQTKSDPVVTFTFQKTTETKIIDGYKCLKLIINYSDGGTTTAWITNDININTAEAIAYFTNGMKGKKSPINTDCANIKGCTLESTYIAKDGSSVFMKLSDIKKGKPDAAFFSTDGFDIVDVTGIQFFK